MISLLFQNIHLKLSYLIGSRKNQPFKIGALNDDEPELRSTPSPPRRNYRLFWREF